MRTSFGEAGVQAALIGALLLGCVDNPYVIGRYRDGGADGGSDAGAASDECSGERAGALVCSGFEGEDFADWDDTAVTAEGALERSTERAHSGETSLHATSDAMQTTAVVAREFAPRTSGELYLRAFVYIPAGPPTETMNLFFLGFEPNPSPSAPFEGLDVNLEDDAVQVYSPQNDPARVTGALTVPRDRWFCLRARFAIGDADGAVEVFVDDAPALAVDPFDTLPDAGVTTFRAGIDWSSAQEAFFEVYIDDVVLDATEVACR